MDETTQQQALEDLRNANPGWHFWEGVGGDLVYCRKLNSSPPVVLRAAGVSGLAGQIDDYRKNGRRQS